MLRVVKDSQKNKTSLQKPPYEPTHTSLIVLQSFGAQSPLTAARPGKSSTLVVKEQTQRFLPVPGREKESRETSRRHKVSNDA